VPASPGGGQRSWRLVSRSGPISAAKLGPSGNDIDVAPQVWLDKLTREEGTEVRWRCVAELADDYYGVYNFNWGYYLESLRLLCVTGTGKPFQAGSGRYAGG
jgi:hypothetical protein